MQNLKEICYSPNLNPIPNPDLLFLSADGGQVKFHACLESISVAAQCAAGGAVRFIHFPTLNAATHSGERSGLFFFFAFVAAKFPLREKSSF